MNGSNVQKSLGTLSLTGGMNDHTRDLSHHLKENLNDAKGKSFVRMLFLQCTLGFTLGRNSECNIYRKI